MSALCRHLHKRKVSQFGPIFLTLHSCYIVCFACRMQLCVNVRGTAVQFGQQLAEFCSQEFDGNVQQAQFQISMVLYCPTFCIDFRYATFFCSQEVLQKTSRGLCDL